MERDEVWELLCAEESNDVSELEDVTSTLDLQSQTFTQSLTEHSRNPISFTRAQNIAHAEHEYVSAFGRFSNAIDRDPYLDGNQKQFIIATTILNEEIVRLAHIETLLETKPHTLARTEYTDINNEIIKIYINPPINNSINDSLKILFDFMIRKDVTIYRQNVIRG